MANRYTMATSDGPPDREVRQGFRFGMGLVVVALIVAVVLIGAGVYFFVTHPQGVTAGPNPSIGHADVNQAKPNLPPAPAAPPQSK